MSVCADEQMGVPTAVYRFYDACGGLIYVGVARWPVSRWREHARVASWWAEVAVKEYEWHSSRTDALETEARLIQIFRPRHNVVIPGETTRRRFDVMLPMEVITEVKALARSADSERQGSAGYPKGGGASAGGIVRATLALLLADEEFRALVMRRAEEEWRVMDAEARRPRRAS